MLLLDLVVLLRSRDYRYLIISIRSRLFHFDKWQLVSPDPLSTQVVCPRQVGFCWNTKLRTTKQVELLCFLHSKLCVLLVLLHFLFHSFLVVGVSFSALFQLPKPVYNAPSCTSWTGAFVSVVDCLSHWFNHTAFTSWFFSLTFLFFPFSSPFLLQRRWKSRWNILRFAYSGQSVVSWKRTGCLFRLQNALFSTPSHVSVARKYRWNIPQYAGISSSFFKEAISVHVFFDDWNQQLKCLWWVCPWSAGALGFILTISFHRL